MLSRSTIDLQSYRDDRIQLDFKSKSVLGPNRISEIFVSNPLSLFCMQALLESVHDACGSVLCDPLTSDIESDKYTVP